MTKWPMVRLERLVIPIERPEIPAPGISYRQIGVKLWGEGAYQRETIDGGATKYKTFSRVEADDIIVNKIWARNGSVALVPTSLAGSYVSSEFPTFIPIREKLEPRWFHWICKTKFFWDQCNDKSRGTSGKNRIRPERFLEIEIPLPPPLEQRRIVARIEALAAKIEEIRNLQQQTKDETGTLEVSIIARVLAKTAIDGFLSDILLEKPKNGWSAKCDNLETGTPVLNLGAVTGFKYRQNEFKKTSEPVSENAHYWLKKGDLLITRSNTPELVGHTAIYNGFPSPCIYPDLMMRLATNNEKANKQFVHLWLRSKPVRDYIKSSAKGTSPTMRKITQDVVMKIPFPSSLEITKQLLLVTYLDSFQAKLDVLKKLQRETAAELDALLLSVLDKAFKGKF